MPVPSANSDPALGSDGLGDLILQVQDLRQRVLNLEERLLAAALPLQVGEAVPTLPAMGFDLPPNTVSVLGRMLWRSPAPTFFAL